MRVTGYAGVLVMCLAWMMATPAAADFLDDKSCEQLGVEQEALKALGLEKEMAKGPEWARANMAQSDLNLIRRFIDVSERIKFRCFGVTTARLEGAPSATPVGGLIPPPPPPVRRGNAAVSPKPIAPKFVAPKPVTATVAAPIRPKAQPQKPVPPQKAGES